MPSVGQPGLVGSVLGTELDGDDSGDDEGDAGQHRAGLLIV